LFNFAFSKLVGVASIKAYRTLVWQVEECG